MNNPFASPTDDPSVPLMNDSSFPQWLGRYPFRFVSNTSKVVWLPVCVTIDLIQPPKIQSLFSIPSVCVDLVFGYWLANDPETALILCHESALYVFSQNEFIRMIEIWWLQYRWKIAGQQPDMCFYATHCAILQRNVEILKVICKLQFFVPMTRHAPDNILPAVFTKTISDWQLNRMDYILAPYLQRNVELIQFLIDSIIAEHDLIALLCRALIQGASRVLNLLEDLPIVVNYGMIRYDKTKVCFVFASPAKKHRFFQKVERFRIHTGFKHRTHYTAKQYMQFKKQKKRFIEINEETFEVFA